MTSKLDLIIFQNWLLLAVLLVLLISNLAINWKQIKRNKNHSDRNADLLADLWERGEIEEVLIETEVMLTELPNRVDALYFRGKAMLNIENFDEAKALFQKMAKADFMLRETAEEYLREVEIKTTNKARNEMDGSVEPPIR